MVRRVVLCGCWLLLGASAPVAEARVERGTMTVAGIERSWRVLVPEGLRPGAPVVVVLHGGGDHVDQMAAGTGFDAAAQAHGFLAVYPQAHTTRFNGGLCCARTRGDVQFADRLVERVVRRHRADRRRVYAAGFSNGGFLAYRLACTRAGRFAGIAAVAATELTVPCRPRRPVSILHVQARDETRVPFGGGRWAGMPLARGRYAGSPGAFALMRRWRARNGCRRGTTAVERLPHVTTWTTTRCRGRSQVRLVAPATGGHRWFGGLPPYGSPDDPVSATAQILGFFSLGGRHNVD